MLYNGLGRYDAALAAARRACRYEDLGFFGWALVELIEAAARCRITVHLARARLLYGEWPAPDTAA